MRSARTASIAFRVALAAVFGFMSLGHSTIMAVAKANQAPSTHEVNVHPNGEPSQHHQIASQVAAGHDHEPAQAPSGAAICNAVGCFVLVAPASTLEPHSQLVLLERLGIPVARAMLAAALDPLVPPPRLQD